MSVLFRVCLFLGSVFMFGYTVKKIRKEQMKIGDAVFWILFYFSILVLSIFPSIAMFFSDILAIQSPANFVYLAVIALLLMVTFRLSAKLSKMEGRLEALAQAYAIDQKERREEKENDIEWRK